MPALELLGFGILEIILAIYILAGSYSIGYLFLRTGWPKIRILEENYRTGWSVIFGIAFTIACIALAIVFGIRESFPAILAVVLAVILALLNARRMFFASQTITVAIPKEEAASRIVAEKTVENLAADKQFFLNKSISESQAEKIREALSKKEQ